LLSEQQVWFFPAGKSSGLPLEIFDEAGMNDIRGISGHEARQYLTDADGTVRCTLCSHRCNIKESAYGICRIRKNHGGVLYTEGYAQVSAEAVDPVEKKPLYHFLPGTTTYSLGGIGCNFSCSHCQNWHISKPGRYPVPVREILPQEGIRRALSNQCASVSWTYNEPTLSYEYSQDMGTLAKREGLKTIYVTNGYMTEEALSDLAPVLDAWRVDIKSFSDDFYRSVCKARLDPVLTSTTKARELGIHIETVTLVIPGLNDSLEEMTQLIDWVINTLGPETPMHFTRFHPDFQMTDRPATPIRTLEKIYECAQERGLLYPYLGNVGGHQYENTFCPECKQTLISRTGYRIRIEHLEKDRCNHCNAKIPGIIRE
jgi:pyruvate formate lyase activating enzyme